MAIEGIAVGDFKGLQRLRERAQDDSNKALPEVAKQFEAIFLQSMLKSMRLGQHFLDESSPFRGKDTETFQDMLDGQYAAKISSGSGIGLASMLTRQLSHLPKSLAVKPSAVENPIMPAMTAAKPPLTMPLTTTEIKPAAETQSIDEFVKSIWPYARQAASAIGLDPKILVAQAALETGWGHFVAKDADGSSSHNLFNIKSNGKKSADSVDIKTTEYVANTPIKTTASFKKYSSIEHSFKDYVSLIKDNERYGQALANASDPQRFVHEMHDAGYATDPHYADKILSIYNGDELQQALERNGYIMR